ncbi:transposon Ty3-I Gag-Pol polyprotein [Trichonephila clavipes]|nr:transposon Ty3-I Gag-Pol polyprotein [Trichonephila clavipes]
MVQVCSSRTENIQYNDFTKHSDDAVSTLDRVKMRTKQDLEILKLLEEESWRHSPKIAYQYEIGDIVAIQRTQFGTGLKLRPKFFGPYEVVKVKPKDRYDVRQIDCMKDPILHPQQFDMKMWGGTV